MSPTPPLPPMSYGTRTSGTSGHGKTGLPVGLRPACSNILANAPAILFSYFPVVPMFPMPPAPHLSPMSYGTRTSGTLANRKTGLPVGLRPACSNRFPTLLPILCFLCSCCPVCPVSPTPPLSAMSYGTRNSGKIGK